MSGLDGINYDGELKYLKELDKLVRIRAISSLVGELRLENAELREQNAEWKKENAELKRALHFWITLNT